MGAGSPFSDALGSIWSPIGLTDGFVDLPDVWLLRCGAPPGAQVRDFDDLPLDTTLSSLNDDPSVSLLAPGSETVVAPSQGTFTAPHALRFSVDVTQNPELPAGPSRITSTDFFTYFGLMVGLESAIDEEVVVELVGVSRSSGLDLDRITLGPEAAPATTCMIVVAPGARFDTVELRVYGASRRVVPLIVDHVFWSHDEVYPGPTRPEPADVEILFPAEGARLPTVAGTTIVGRVRWPEALSLTQVNVASPSWDGSRVTVRRASFSRSSVDGTERSAFFWIDDVEVPPGRFEVAVSAYGPNLRGGTSTTLEGVGFLAPPDDEYRAIAEGNVDVIPWAMEVTQAVRGPLAVMAPGSSAVDDFPLVTGKRTVVRGYAVQQLPDLAGIAERPLEVEALLHGTRDGVTLPFSPLRPDVTPVRLSGFDPGPAAERAARPFVENTFNFVLPYQWTEAGDIDLRLEVNPLSSMFHVAERGGTDGWLNTITRRVTFTDVGRVGVSAISYEVYWRCTEDMTDGDARHPCSGMSEGDVVSSFATQADVRRVLPVWWKMLPTPGDFPAYYTFGSVKVPHRDDSPRADIPDRDRDGIATSVSWEDLRNVYYDLYCEGPDDQRIMRAPSVRNFVVLIEPWWTPIPNSGCAWLNRVSAFRTSLSGFTAAQEAAHTVGLEHTGNAHGELSGGGAVIRFDGDHGEISLPDDPAWGFDTATMTVIRPALRRHVHDYLSYGGGLTWTSVGTWEAMFNALSRNRTVGETRGRVITAGGGERSRSAGAPDAGGPAEALVVTGRVDDSGSIVLGTPYLAPRGLLAADPGDTVTVQLLDASGTVVAEASGGLYAGRTHGGASTGFAVELPPITDAAGLRVEAEGSDPFTVDASQAEARITITSVPTGGTGALTWNAEGVGPPFTVEASNDGGASWWHLATTAGSSIPFDSSLALQGPGWTLRVQGSDGVRIAASEASEVDLGIAPPVALIGTPQPGARVYPGMVRVEAAAAALGDVATEFQWILDGEVVDAGRTGFVPVLTEGEHTITLRVTNASGGDEASVTVVTGADPDGDGLSSAWETRYGFDPDAFDDPAEDPDDDALPIGIEYGIGTDPHDPDTDGDGFSDGREFIGDGDPLDPDVVPGPVHGLDDESGSAPAPDVPSAAPDTTAAQPAAATDDQDGGSSVVPIVVIVLLVAAGAGGTAVFVRRRRAA